jgi:hypothetical protein
MGVFAAKLESARKVREHLLRERVKSTCCVEKGQLLGSVHVEERRGKRAALPNQTRCFFWPSDRIRCGSNARKLDRRREKKRQKASIARSREALKRKKE